MPPVGWKALSKEEKIKLMAWKKVHVPVSEMARLLVRNRSTVKRFFQPTGGMVGNKQNLKLET